MPAPVGPTMDDLLGELDLGVRCALVRVPRGDGRRYVGRADDIAPEFLQGLVRIERLVVGIAVEERRGFVGHDLFEYRSDRFALGEPLAPDTGEELGRVGLVETDRARRPTIFESLRVQLVEQARPSRSREADDRQRAEMGFGCPG